MSQTPITLGTEEKDNVREDSADNHIQTLGGDDHVVAGLGRDFVEGGDGNDTIIGDAPDQAVSVTDLITMQEDRDVTVTFDYENAGFRNTFGVYKVDPETGEIYDVEIVWANASLVGGGGDLIGGESSKTIATEAGDQIGFFLIGDGFSANDFDDLENGRFEFRNADGSPATINSAAPELYFVENNDDDDDDDDDRDDDDDGDSDGATRILNPIYHSAAHGENVGLNPDNIVHTVGLLNSGDGVIQLGFEDWFTGGDNDFNDTVVTVDIGESTAEVLNAHFEQNLSNETENLDVGGDGTSPFDPGLTIDRLHGEDGSDHLEGMQGNDLLVGDRSGAEWRIVDGEWVYDASRQATGGEQDTHDDVLIGGSGNDVLNGGLGDDIHIGGAGDDRINAGDGRDVADGGDGRDEINLEDGADIGTGGLGADVIHAGAGNDVVYGDLGNVLDNGDYGADPHSGIGFSYLGAEGGWIGGSPAVDAENVQTRSVMQSISTTAGETYSMNFDLALGSLAASGAARVEVLWNGELVDTIEPGSALFEQYSVSVVGTGGDDQLEFREIIELDDVATAQAVYTTEAELLINGETYELDGFAPGQSNLYQVISDQLYRFDTEAQTYETIGDGLGFNVNAAGFNPANNLVYGFATSTGVDVLGNAVTKHDLVAIDAKGDAYRVGDVPFEIEIGNNSVYIGDFGPDGMLYVMNGGHRSEMFRVDVNNVSGDGTLTYEAVPLPQDQLSGFADWAWVESEGAFVGVGSNGTVYSIDPFNLTDGEATVTTASVTTTVTDAGVIDGVPRGSAWGAVFTDADGNLYAGLNSGDHDLDASTVKSGGLYQITGFSSGEAQAVLLSESPTTGSNDGVSDPRSISSFATTDGDASVLIRNVSLTGTAGEDDLITGGEGDDRIYGEGGNDTIHGQEGNDRVDGGVGDDVIFGDEGDDFITGGEGADHIEGGTGNDSLAGNVGNDTLMAGGGRDYVHGGEGSDKVVGGAGADTLEGGAGDDHLWGGEWSADGDADTFIFSPGSGQDMVHDFETAHDVIDLSAYGISWGDLQGNMQDLGWAVSIELGALGGEEGDRIFLTNVSTDDLSSDNFDLGGE